MNPRAPGHLVDTPSRPPPAPHPGRHGLGRAAAGLAALALLLGGCDKIRKAMEYHPEERKEPGAPASSSAPPAATPSQALPPPEAPAPAAPPARVRQWSPREIEARLRTTWVNAGGQDFHLVDGRARGRYGMTSIVDEGGRLRQPVYHDFDADGLLDVVVILRTATLDGQSLGAALFLNQDGYLHHAQTVPIDDGAFDRLEVENGRLVLRYSDPEAASGEAATRARRFELLGKTLSEIP